jgi:hypothetical protein
MNGGDFDKSCPTLDGLLESSHGNSARIIEGLYWAALTRPVLRGDSRLNCSDGR